MTRRRLVDRVQGRMNEFARTPALASLISRCFGEDILPHRKTHEWKFEHHEIFGDLYISERDGDECLRPHTNTDSFHHEAFLDKLFWDPNPDHAKVFLLGDVGCGKSTLIDYYLRCYCPANGKRRAEFERKLTINLDAVEYPDIADATENFYYYAQGILRSKCKARGIDVDPLVNRHVPRHSNVRQWVLHALEGISQAPASGPASAVKYLVVVIDNLDQCDLNIQKKYLTIVEGWLRASTINLWRVFVPLWPSTLRKLRNQDFGPARRGVEFGVGAIPIQRILERRVQALAQALAADSRKGDGLGPQAEDTSAYIAGVYSLVRPRVLARINALCNDNGRRKLRVWRGLIQGESAPILWRQARAAAVQTRSYDYELLDAILCGSHDAFVPEACGIANLFTMGQGRNHARDLLAGLHAVTLLDQEKVEHRSAFYTALLRLGYQTEDIRAVDSALRQFNFYHEVPSFSGSLPDAELEVHHSVVKGYLELCVEPVYLDNAAQVTPVDPEVHARLTRTRGDRSDDFPDRVTSTLRFIEFIRANEEAFCDPAHLEPAHRDVFVFHLPRLNIPCFWKRMATLYRERLEGLRRSLYRPSTSDLWWDETLNRPLFAEAEAEPWCLVPAGASQGCSPGQAGIRESR